jgi:ribosome-binding factor A
MSERRQLSVGRLLREVISEILRDEMRDPRVRFVSVADVEVSSDLQHAKVHLSVLGADEAECQERFRAVEAARGFIRRAVGARVRLRLLPELHFVRDRSAEHAERVQRILTEISREQSAAPAPPAATAAEEAPGEAADE